MEMINNSSKGTGKIQRDQSFRQTDGFHRKESGEALSVRQTDILELAAQGLSTKLIARRLGIKFYTAATHLKNIYRKLGVRKRASAVARFYRTECPHCGWDLKSGTGSAQILDKVEMKQPLVDRIDSQAKVHGWIAGFAFTLIAMSNLKP